MLIKVPGGPTSSGPDLSTRTTMPVAGWLAAARPQVADESDAGKEGSVARWTHCGVAATGVLAPLHLCSYRLVSTSSVLICSKGD